MGRHSSDRRVEVRHLEDERRHRHGIGCQHPDGAHTDTALLRHRHGRRRQHTRRYRCLPKSDRLLRCRASRDRCRL